MFFFENFGRFQTGLESLKNTLAAANRMAPTLKPLLIKGPIGSGRKELALSVIEKSSRANRTVERYYPGNIGEMTRSLGTILVDDLDRMNRFEQTQILKQLSTCLGERSMESPRWIFIATDEILALVRRGEILPALYHVLSENILCLPSLSDRREDLPSLAEAYVQELNQTFTAQKRLSASAQQKLCSMNLTKNMSEFYSRIESAFTKSNGPLIELTDFGFEDLQISTGYAQAGLSLSEMERRLILQTLELTQNNRTKAAELLGISIRTLRNKLTEYRDQEGA